MDFKCMSTCTSVVFTFIGTNNHGSIKLWNLRKLVSYKIIIIMISLYVYWNHCTVQSDPLANLQVQWDRMYTCFMSCQHNQVNATVLLRLTYPALTFRHFINQPKQTGVSGWVKSVFFCLVCLPDVYWCS